jgi:hypothetical protein
VQDGLRTLARQSGTLRDLLAPPAESEAETARTVAAVMARIRAAVDVAAAG